MPHQNVCRFVLLVPTRSGSGPRTTCLHGCWRRWLLSWGLLLGLATTGRGQAPVWQQVEQSVGGSIRGGTSVVAANGDIVITGGFSGQVRLGGLPPLVAGSDLSTLVARRAGPTGRWLWAVTFTATQSGRGGNGLALAPNGDVVVAGSFRGTLTLPGLPPLTTPVSTTAGFVVRLNGSTGQGLWAEAESRAVIFYPAALVVAPNDDVLLSGFYVGVATFGLLPPLPNSGNGYDMFVARLDGTTRQWRWATGGGGPGFDGGNALRRLTGGDVVVAGSSQAAVQLGGLPLPGGGQPTAWVARLAGDTGRWQWLSAATAPNGHFNLHSVHLTPAEDVLISGQFAGTATFGQLPPLRSSTANTDLFVARLSSSGRWRWATAGGGRGQELSVPALTTTATGAGVVAGIFVSDSTRFGSLPGLRNAGHHDVVVAQLDSSGRPWRWAVAAGGASEEQPASLHALPDGRLLLTGSFGDQARFGNLTPLRTETPEHLGLFLAYLAAGPAMPSPCPDTLTAASLPGLRLLRDSLPCGGPVQLRAVGAPAGSRFRWSTGDTTATLTAPAGGRYLLAITTPDRCRYRLVVAVGFGATASNALPNIITPNGDGLNEFFKVPQLPAGTRLQVYTRWGRCIYRSNDYNNDWKADGHLAGLYYYVLEHPGLCPTPRLKGWLAVLR